MKRVKVSDYDKILTLFTTKAGKISVSVKGSQNPKSKMAAGAHPFVYGEFAISKSGRLSRATSIDAKETFYHLREDLDKLTVASYFLELVNIVTVEDVVNQPLFQILLYYLSYIDKSKDIKKMPLVKVAFELQLLDTIGLKPEMHHCVNCHKLSENPKFSVADGGIVCEDCYEFYPDDYKIGSVIQKLMTYILNHSLSDILNQEIDDILVKKIDVLNQQFLKHHLERKGFKSLMHF
ncbi:MAG: DNA repair protein RecO [Clostridia bacterium]|nr:DNA repair protein RecO [Clostridia bacterium]